MAHRVEHIGDATPVETRTTGAAVMTKTCALPGCNRPSGKVHNARYCSRRHGQLARLPLLQEKRRLEREAAPPAPQPTAICAYPGCFLVVRSVGCGRAARYCSQNHKWAADDLRKRERRAAEREAARIRAIEEAAEKEAARIRLATPIPPLVFVDDKRAKADHGSPGNLRAIARLVYASGASPLADI